MTVITILCHGTGSCTGQHNFNDEIIGYLDSNIVQHELNFSHIYCSPGPGSTEAPHLSKKVFSYTPEKGFSQEIQFGHVKASRWDTRYISFYRAYTGMRHWSETAHNHTMSNAEGRYAGGTTEKGFGAENVAESFKVREATLWQAVRDNSANTGNFMVRRLGLGVMHAASKTSFLKQTVNTDVGVASFAGGMFGGIGTQAELDNIVSFLKAHKDNFQVTAINLVGWSRGGVQCVRVANAIQNKHCLAHLRGADVNIFAIDPVPGHAQESEKHHVEQIKVLPPCVKQYIACVSLNDGRRLSFNPLHNTMKYDSRQLLLAFPGDHSDLAFKNRASGKIILHMILHFLKNNGTKFKDPQFKGVFLRPTELREQFDHCLRNTAPGVSKALTIAGPNAGAFFNSDKSRFMQGGQRLCLQIYSGIFYNAFHAELFKSLLPVEFGHLRNFSSDSPSLGGVRYFGGAGHYDLYHEAINKSKNTAYTIKGCDYAAGKTLIKHYKLDRALGILN